MGKFTPHCISCPIRRASLFQGLSTQSLHALEESANSNTYRAGQDIFLQNNRPYGIYHIYSGKVKLYKIGQGGRRQIVRMAKAGDMLGYRAILANEPYKASAQAIEDTTACFIEKAAFLAVLRKDGNFAHNIITVLSRDLRRAEERLTSAVQKNVKQRVAESLLFLLDEYRAQDSSAISVQLSREELGELADTSRETVTRILKQLEKEALISLDRRKVGIIKPDRLKKLAGLAD